MLQRNYLYSERPISDLLLRLPLVPLPPGLPLALPPLCGDLARFREFVSVIGSDRLLVGGTELWRGRESALGAISSLENPIVMQNPT